MILAAAAVLILTVMAHRPTLYSAYFPRIIFGRAPSSQTFPEAMDYPLNWFQNHAADLDQIEQLSLARSNHPVDFLLWPEAPAPFSFEDAQFARRASLLAIHFPACRFSAGSH